MVFDVVDHDQEGEVDFKKFCLINTDKSQNVFGMIDDIKRKASIQTDKDEQQLLKEKYDYLVQLQRQMHGKGNDALDRNKDLKKIKNIIAESVLQKPPLHKDFHKYMKKKHYQKPLPYARTEHREQAGPPSPPKNKDINQFQIDAGRRIKPKEQQQQEDEHQKKLDGEQQ